MDVTEKCLTFLDSVKWYGFVEINEVTLIYTFVDLFHNFYLLFNNKYQSFYF